MAKDNRTEHVVTIGGIEHTFLLTDEDAARYPNAKKSAGAAKRLATEASQALAGSSSTPDEGDEGDGEKAGTTPANKAATTQTK